MPRSLARVLPLQNLRRTSFAPAARCAAPPVARSRRRSPPVPFPNAGGLAADRDPYADPAAPYKADRVQASGKFPEPLLNTPKTITVLSKEVLADKNITSLREIGALHRRRDAGVGRGRQRLRRPLLHPRFRRAQRRLHRRHPRSRRQRSARISSPSRSRFCVARPRPMPAAAPPAAPSISSPSRRAIATSTTPRARSAPTTPSASRSTSTR